MVQGPDAHGDGRWTRPLNLLQSCVLFLQQFLLLEQLLVSLFQCVLAGSRLRSWRRRYCFVSGFFFVGFWVFFLREKGREKDMGRKRRKKKRKAQTIKCGMQNSIKIMVD